MIQDSISHEQSISLSDELFHLLTVSFLTFLTCNFCAGNKWMTSPIVLSLDSAATQSNVVIHLGFNEGSWPPPDDWIHLVWILFSMQMTQLSDVLDDSVWMTEL